MLLFKGEFLNFLVLQQIYQLWFIDNKTSRYSNIDTVIKKFFLKFDIFGTKITTVKELLENLTKLILYIMIIS